MFTSYHEFDKFLKCEVHHLLSVSFPLVSEVYGKPTGAKFKKQIVFTFNNFFYQGQERFQSSSPKSSHVQRIFFQGHGIF